MSRSGFLPLLLAAAVGCNGGGTEPKPQPRPDPVPTTLSVGPDDPSLTDGSTRQLTATVVDQNGAVMTSLPAGTALGWLSRDASVASVDANGMVTALRPGTSWIRVSVGALADSTRVTVTAVPSQIAVVGVAERSATAGRVVLDSLAIRVTDRHGTGMEGVAVTFAATAGGGEVTPATVVTRADGTARAAWRLGTAVGEQRATATAAGLTGSPVGFYAVATAPVPIRVTLTPEFAVVAVGGTQAFTAEVTAVDGLPIPGANVGMGSTNDAVVTVTAAGSATGVAPGVARIRASIAARADTSTVAVLGPNSILATAFAGGVIDASAQRGDTVRVPVILDLSRPSPTGDLGSVQLDVLYDPTVLQFVRADDILSGTVSNLRGGGLYGIAFAAAQAQGAGSVRLATLVLVVRADAGVGAMSTLNVHVTEAPRSTGFAQYAAPLVVPGRVRVR